MTKKKEKKSQKIKLKPPFGEDTAGNKEDSDRAEASNKTIIDDFPNHTPTYDDVRSKTKIV